MRIVLGTLILALSFQASSSDWEPMGPWGGSDILLKTPDPSGHRVYAISANGLFRSDNRGESWSVVAAPDNRSVYPGKSQFAVTREDPERVAAVFDNQFAYLSVNGGDDWQLIDSTPGPPLPSHITAITIDHHNPDRISLFHGTVYDPLLVAPPGPVWRHSNNAGISFAESNGPVVSDHCEQWQRQRERGDEIGGISHSESHQS